MKNYNKITVFLALAMVICIFAVGSASAASAGNNSTVNTTSTTSGLANTSCPEYQVNSNHTGQSSYEGPKTNNTKWVFKNMTVYGSAVTGSDGMVYVGSYDGKLYAFKSDGTLKWTYTTASYIMCSPAVSSDGTIYVSCWMNSTLYAINPNGTLKWKYNTGSYNFGSSPVIGSDGTIYISNYNGTIYAISPNGKVKWNYKLDTTIYGSSVALGSDGTIYIPGYNGNLYALNANGTKKWSVNLMEASGMNDEFAQKGWNGYTGSIYYTSPSIGSDGTIYIGNQLDILFAVHPNGTISWAYRIDIPTTGESIHGTPSIAPDGTIYVVSSSKINAVSSDGKLLWSQSTGGISSEGSISAVIGSDGTIYVGGKGGLYAFNSNGTLKWVYSGGEVSSSPVIGSDNTLYVGTENGAFYAFNDKCPTVNSVDPDSKTNVSPTNVIKVTFGEPVKAGNSWFELKNSKGVSIPYTASINGNVLTLNLKSMLTAGTYTLIIHTGSVTDLSGNNVTLYSGSFTVDTTPPKVKTVDPANKATSISPTKTIKVTFNEPVKTGNNYIELKGSNGQVVTCTSSISGSVLTLKPTTTLTKGVKYTIILHTGSITDIAGNNLALYSSVFTVETVPPTVKSVDPTNKATNIAINKTIKVTFSETIKAGTNYIELKNSKGKTVAINKTISGNVLTITPVSALTKGTKYTLILHTGCVTDIAGNNLALHSNVFTTDSTAPKVKTVDPANKATNVVTTKVIKITFREAIKVGNNYIEIKGSNGEVVYLTKSISGNVLTLKPGSALTPGVTYTLIIHSGSVTDMAGNGVATYSSTFKVKK